MAQTTKQTQEPEGLVAKIKRHPIFVAVAGVIVVAGLAIGGYLLYQKYVVEPENNEAATKIATAQSMFNSAYYDQSLEAGNYDAALNGDAKNPGLLKIISQYGGTKTGNLACLYAGLAYFYKGQYDNAIKYLEEFDPQDDQMISNNAIVALGDCYVAKKDYDKAVDLYKKAASRADNPIVSPTALIKAGEVLESQGKAEEALELYNEVKTKYSQSGPAENIDKYIERATK